MTNKSLYFACLLSPVYASVARPHALSGTKIERETVLKPQIWSNSAHQRHFITNPTWPCSARKRLRSPGMFIALQAILQKLQLSRVCRETRTSVRGKARVSESSYAPLHKPAMGQEKYIFPWVVFAHGCSYKRSSALHLWNTLILCVMCVCNT